MLAGGVDVAVVSKRLGHSSITITSDTFSHLIGGIGRQAADAAEAVVPPRRIASKVTAVSPDAQHGPTVRPPQAAHRTPGARA
jgi:hypothetical protein